MIGVYVTVAALAAVSLAFLTELYKVGQRPKGAPPGPPTIPILGNLHLVLMTLHF